MQDIYYKTFDPVVNRYGYKIHLAIIDELFMTKVFTPYSTKQIRYFADESALTYYINLINEDRRY